jgi:hypothetical protein
MAAEFDRFFQVTAQDLLDGGIFRTIAIACHPGQHRYYPADFRLISLALLAKACGAEDAHRRKVGGSSGRLQQHPWAQQRDSRRDSSASMASMSMSLIPWRRPKLRRGTSTHSGAEVAPSTSAGGTSAGGTQLTTPRRAESSPAFPPVSSNFTKEGMELPTESLTPGGSKHTPSRAAAAARSILKGKDRALPAPAYRRAAGCSSEYDECVGGARGSADGCGGECSTLRSSPEGECTSMRRSSADRSSRARVAVEERQPLSPRCSSSSADQRASEPPACPTAETLAELPPVRFFGC